MDLEGEISQDIPTSILQKSLRPSRLPEIGWLSYVQ